MSGEPANPSPAIFQSDYEHFTLATWTGDGGAANDVPSPRVPLH